MPLRIRRPLRRLTGWRYLKPAELSLRVIEGRTPGRWTRTAGCVVVASDIDADAGVGAVWIQSGLKSENPTEHVFLYERDEHGWRSLGGGTNSGGRSAMLEPRPTAARSGPASMLVGRGSAASRSHLDRVQNGSQKTVADAGWVASYILRVASEVDHVVAGTRSIPVAAHGNVIVAWKSPPTWRVSARPNLVALAQDGTLLTTLGPEDILDSLTIESLAK